jgi:hypothetical protein
VQPPLHAPLQGLQEGFGLRHQLRHLHLQAVQGRQGTHTGMQRGKLSGLASARVAGLSAWQVMRGSSYFLSQARRTQADLVQHRALLPVLVCLRHHIPGAAPCSKQGNQCSEDVSGENTRQNITAAPAAGLHH